MLCRSHTYASKDSAKIQCIGISKYEITKLLESEYKSSLPSIEEIEKKIKEIDTDN